MIGASIFMLEKFFCKKFLDTILAEHSAPREIPYGTLSTQGGIGGQPGGKEAPRRWLIRIVDDLTPIMQTISK